MHYCTVNHLFIHKTKELPALLDEIVSHGPSAQTIAKLNYACRHLSGAAETCVDVLQARLRERFCRAH
jgi:hypothetical protein